MFDRIRAFAARFMKGGAAVTQNTERNMKLCTELWWQIYSNNAPWIGEKVKPLPIAAISTAYVANLVGNELKFELLDKFLNKQLQRNFLPLIDEITQKCLVGGYAVIKPYITRNSDIFFDAGYSYNFLPLAFSENGDITEGKFFDAVEYKGNVFTRVEYHKYADGIHYVENKAYINGTKSEVSLERVPRWAGLDSSGKIKSDRPMIITFRTPYANNLNLASELPISFIANSVKTLEDIDFAHTAYRGELKKMEAKVFADKMLLRDKGLVDDYYVNFETDSQIGIDKQILAYAPAVREAEYKSGLNTALRLFEVETGLSRGTLNFDATKGYVTATQILSEDKTTYNTVKQIQKQLQKALVGLAEVTERLAEEYGISVSKGEPVIEFGDSVFEDTGTEFTRRLQLVESGLLKPELFNEWYFGVSQKDAKAMLGDMEVTFGGDG